MCAGPVIFWIEIRTRDMNIQCHKLYVSITNHNIYKVIFYKSYLLYKKCFNHVLNIIF